MNKHTKLAVALTKGKTFTIAQIRSKFGLSNPTAAIAYLRNEAGFGRSIVTSVKNKKTVYSYAG